ncbi:helix-turn-helix domain-containing protein [Pedobacter deserti]|uniref:helix-turn-helix domain-containing protein n=1 Tax=Pedobacter deserti TaxID=2817382 RepID=UPI002109FE65|nr:helix-turn-helix domain-containing protein [Pedobacter sp. SYSU D00382]
MRKDNYLFESSLKTFGLLHFDQVEAAGIDAYKSYIKVLYLPEGYTIKVDFAVYNTSKPTLLFVAPNQHIELERLGDRPGHFVYYNRDFYCIQINDAEVSCDGLLFNNIHNMPVVVLESREAAFIDYLFSELEDEFLNNDSSMEEMLRTYLKQLLIKATRLWKIQHLDRVVTEQHADLEFFRKFTLLVDANYKQKHTVADYADLLYMSPKTITHKFKRLNLPQPNEVIKNRIVLEAKRLLVHTGMTAKEIAYDLGYDDPAYFSRLFLVKTGESPTGFRTKYNHS